MQEKVSLNYIITEVLKDNGVEADEANVRVLWNAFTRLVERLGANKEVIKNGGKNFEFDKAEIPFMKTLLYKLYRNEGIIAKFTNERHRNKKFSSQDVYELVQSLRDEAKEEGMDEDELDYLEQFLGSIFLVSPLRSIEYCHMMIDTIASELHDLTSDQQSTYLQKVEDILFNILEPILYKEMALRFLESTIRTEKIAMDIELTKKMAEDNIGIQNYVGLDPEIRYEYMQRDKAVLEAIQEDNDLRQYIEKKLGKKAEEIFNYAALDMEDKPE